MSGNFCKHLAGLTNTNAKNMLSTMPSSKVSTFRPPLPPNKQKTQWTALAESFHDSECNKVIPYLGVNSNEAVDSFKLCLIYGNEKNDGNLGGRNNYVKSDTINPFPPRLVGCTASPNSFHCASALSLLSNAILIDKSEKYNYTDTKNIAEVYNETIFSRCKRARSIDTTSDEDSSETSPKSAAVLNGIVEDNEADSMLRWVK